MVVIELSRLGSSQTEGDHIQGICLQLGNDRLLKPDDHVDRAQWNCHLDIVLVEWVRPCRDIEDQDRARWEDPDTLSRKDFYFLGNSNLCLQDSFDLDSLGRGIEQDIVLGRYRRLDTDCPHLVDIVLQDLNHLDIYPELVSRQGNDCPVYHHQDTD